MVNRVTFVVVSRIMVILHGVTVVLAPVAAVAAALDRLLALAVGIRTAVAPALDIVLIVPIVTAPLVRSVPNAHSKAKELLVPVANAPDILVTRRMLVMTVLLQHMAMDLPGRNAFVGNAMAVAALLQAIAVLQLLVTVAPAVKLKFRIVVTAVSMVTTPPPTILNSYNRIGHH